jgi:hypothetical protein
LLVGVLDEHDLENQRNQIGGEEHHFHGVFLRFDGLDTDEVGGVHYVGFEGFFWHLQLGVHRANELALLVFEHADVAHEFARL